MPGVDQLANASEDQSSPLIERGVKRKARPMVNGVRKFTWKELGKLNERHNAHVAYRGKVYDVSSFVSHHPGGVDQIMMGAGRDITQVFESYHNLEVSKVMEEYYVGDLVDNELPVFPERGEFYRTLKQRIDQYMIDHNLVCNTLYTYNLCTCYPRVLTDPKIDYWMFLRYIIFTTLTFASWYLMMVYQSVFPLLVLFSMSWGFFSSVIAFTVWHDAVHYAVTHKPWVWKVLMGLSDTIVGISSYCWRYQHTFGHHPYTNIDQADPDITMHPESSFYIRRIMQNQKWFKFYLYQPLYMPFVYTLLGLRLRLQDFHSLYYHQRSVIRMNPPSVSEWALFWVAKILHILMVAVIPYFYMSLGKLILVNFLYEAVFSNWLSPLTQLNHVTTETEWPLPDKDNVLHKDWAEMQVAVTKDYSTDSWIFTVLTGAMNFQTAHHLFPGILQSHYRWITPIIKQTCQDFGLNYSEVDSFQEAYGLHYAYLKVMGTGADLLKKKE